MKKTIFISILCFVSTGLFSQSLSLDSCKSLALENNRKIKEAQLEYDESEVVKNSLTTKYFPKVMAGGVVMKADDYLLKEEIPSMNLPVYDGNPVNLQSPTQFAYFPGMELNIFDYANMGYIAAIQPVYMGGKVRYGNKLARKGMEVRESNLALKQEEVLLEIENQFWTLISLKEKIETIEMYESLVEQLHKEVSVAFDAGLVLKTDLMKVEMKENEIEGQKIRLKNGIDIMTRMICQSMGVQYNEDIDFEYEEFSIDSKEKEHDPDTSLFGRQEYIMLNRLVEIEKVDRKLKRSDFLPHITVGVQGLYLDIMDNQNSNIIGFATLNIPITDWWGGSYELKKHKLKIQIAENNFYEKSELMKLEIINANNELNESYKQIVIAEKTYAQAGEHLKVVQGNYEAGLVNTSDMLEAQAIFTESKNNLTDALCTNKIKKAIYKKSTGRFIDQ